MRALTSAYWVLMLVWLFAAGCATRKAAPVSTAKPSQPGKPTATAQPTQPPAPALKTAITPRPEPTHDQTARARLWLDSLAAHNRRILYAQGFRIQVYLGPDRAAAMKAKETLYKAFDGQNVYLTYQAPNFRVQLGDFLSRLDAQLYQRQVGRYYPDPLLLEQEIHLR